MPYASSCELTFPHELYDRMQAWNPSVTATFYFNAILMGPLLTIHLSLEAGWQISGSAGTALSNVFGNERKYFSKPCYFVAADKFFVIHAFFRRFSLDACNSSAQSNKKYWMGWWSCFSKYTQRLTLSFRRLADSAVHWGWLVPCRMYVCSMFYAECSRNIWGGGQRLFWPHFESIALHCRVRVGQQGSNIQMWRKHESFVQYLAHYCEIHVATK